MQSSEHTIEFPDGSHQHHVEDIVGILSGSRRQKGWQSLIGRYERTGASRVVKHWKEFANKFFSQEEAERETSRPLAHSPSVDQICAYITYRVHTAKARLDKHITLATLTKELQQLLRFIRYASNHRYNDMERLDMKEHLKDLVTAGSASTKARVKAVVLYADAEDIITYLWCYDEYVFLHPRIMLQLTFWILVTAFWGLRVGELVESSVHRHSNEGLKYKDVTLILYRHQGILRYQILINIRNRKFRRRDETERHQFELQEELDPSKKFMCPVRWFLGLALSDDIFVHYNTSEDLDQRWIPAGANSKIIKIKDEKKELPILRKLKGNNVSEDEILTALSIQHHLKALCQRCGYPDPVTCFSLRRGFGNGVEGQTSSAKFRKAMAHRNDVVYQKHYISSNVSIDVQSILQGVPEDSARLEFTRSIGFKKDFNMPKPYGSFLDKNAERLLDPSILQDIEREHPQSQRRTQVKMARKVQFEKSKKLYFENEKIFNDAEQELENTIAAKASCKPSIMFERMLKYNIHQAAIIKALWSSKSTTVGDCVQSMLPLGNPKEYRVWYPLPITQPDHLLNCPVCGISLRSLKTREAALHQLRCHCAQTKTFFCFGCVECSRIPSSYTKKFFLCDRCAQTDDNHFGIVFWRDLVIKPGRCPFCPEPGILFVRPQALQKHMETHLKALSVGPYHCPAKFCNHQDQLDCIEDLKSHLSKIHGTPILC